MGNDGLGACLLPALIVRDAAVIESGADTADSTIIDAADEPAVDAPVADVRPDTSLADGGIIDASTADTGIVDAGVDTRDTGPPRPTTVFAEDFDTVGMRWRPHFNGSWTIENSLLDGLSATDNGSCNGDLALCEAGPLLVGSLATIPNTEGDSYVLSFDVFMSGSGGTGLTNLFRFSLQDASMTPAWTFGSPTTGRNEVLYVEVDFRTFMALRVRMGLDRRDVDVGHTVLAETPAFTDSGSRLHVEARFCGARGSELRVSLAGVAMTTVSDPRPAGAPALPSLMALVENHGGLSRFDNLRIQRNCP